MATVPYVTSLLMVALAPDDWTVVLCSRFVAGVAQGLLSSNVYASDMSHKDHRQTFKMIEVYILYTGIYFLSSDFKRSK